MNSLLDISHIDVAYGNKQILFDVSLSVSPGRICGIVGESGSGKSTVIYSTLGILGNGEVTSGSICYQGKDLTSLPASRLRQIRGREMALIAQNSIGSFHPTRRIRTQLRELVACHKGVEYKDAEQRMCQLMTAFGLKDTKKILNSHPFELSGGMCQRVSIAMAMCMGPSLLLADEPTSALDVISQAQVVEELARVRQEANVAILIVSHNMGVISNLADDIVVMYAGRILESGPAKTVIEEPSHPYTRNLIRAIPRMGKPAALGIRTNGQDRTLAGCPYQNECPHCEQTCRESVPPLASMHDSHMVRCYKAFQ